MKLTLHTYYQVCDILATTGATEFQLGEALQPLFPKMDTPAKALAWTNHLLAQLQTVKAKKPRLIWLGKKPYRVKKPSQLTFGDWAQFEQAISVFGGDIRNHIHNCIAPFIYPLWGKKSTRLQEQMPTLLLEQGSALVISSLLLFFCECVAKSMTNMRKHCLIQQMEAERKQALWTAPAKKK